MPMIDKNINQKTFKHYNQTLSFKQSTYLTANIVFQTL